MLEYWYKERRTLVDFRRGPLGPYFDGFAAHLKKRGYSHDSAHFILGKCCLFNSFLVDKGIIHAKELTPSLVDLFLDDHLVNFRTTSRSYRARDSITNIIQHLYSYLAGEEVIKLPKSKPVLTRYSWILNPYLKYLQEERQISKTTIQRSNTKLSAFLEGLGDNATRKQLRILKAENIETYVQQHLKDSPENLRSLTGVLRGFLRYCANQGYTSTDLSRIIPSIPSYRLATLPKGMEESALQRLLNAIPKDTPHGARDYAIMLLMMAYGIRGKSVASLLLEDICWPHSTIKIRAQKGGKEVVLPLLESVGEAIVNYLRHRPQNSFKELFLKVMAPWGPLNSMSVSMIVRSYMTKAGIKTAHCGSNTLRHSWAIRALAQGIPIKSIADVLGHRNLDNTFIYAKADIKTLRQVAMPWPERRIR